MIMNAFEIVLLSAVIFSGAYAVVSALIFAYEIWSASHHKSSLTHFPAVSILKPLKGLDDQLEKNLESFFLIDYPNYELIFGVNDTHDPAIDVVRQLRKRYPQITATLVIDPHVRSLNPKINNLRNMLPSARHGYLLISDSNIRVRPDYLSDLMLHMQRDNVGLVTSTIRGVEAKTLAGTFENLHLNSFVATSVFAVRRLFRVPVVIGKSMLFTRETLQRLGGFEFFGDFLAEDQLIGCGIRELGYKIRSSTHFIDNVNERWSWNKYLNRHVRWAKIRRNLDLPNYLAEIFAHPLILAGIFAAFRNDAHGLNVFLVIMAAKYLADLASILMMRSDIKPWHYLLLPIKDLIMFGVWFVPFFSRNIVWRGNLYRIEKRTQLTNRPAVAD